MTIFPTWYPDKWNADSTDKVWSSDGTTNFNLTVDEIGTEVFTDRSTTNLSEGTNEYYTTAKVTTDTAWKADKTNVLELDNTTAFTPTLDYHPATKKSVDDLISGVTPVLIAWSDILYDEAGTTATTISGAELVKTITCGFSGTATFSRVHANNGTSDIVYTINKNDVQVFSTIISTANPTLNTNFDMSAWDVFTFFVNIQDPWTSTSVTTDIEIKGTFIFTPSFT